MYRCSAKTMEKDGQVDRNRIQIINGRIKLYDTEIRLNKTKYDPDYIAPYHPFANQEKRIYRGISYGYWCYFHPRPSKIPIMFVRSKIIINSPEIMVKPATARISIRITTTLISCTSSQSNIIGFSSLMERV